MNELSTQERQLPNTLEEKTKYVLFGAEALNIYRAKLRAMEKAGISKEQYEQLKMEAQETAENLLLFSADIGKELSQIEQTKGNRYSLPSTSGSTKSQAIHNMGFTDRQARDFQTLAKHPEVVKRAIEDARAKDRIVTRQDVFHEIAAENENRRQEEARELREAKQRVKEFEGSKITSINEVKQINEDKGRIFQDFNRGFENAIDGVRSYAGMIDSGRFKDSIEMANKYELQRLADHAEQLFKAALKLQHAIQEVLDEK